MAKILKRNSYGQLYGFPIDIRATSRHVNAATGKSYTYGYAWLAIGRNVDGDFVIWFRGRCFTIYEAPVRSDA